MGIQLGNLTSLCFPFLGRLDESPLSPNSSQSVLNFTTIVAFSSEFLLITIVIIIPISVITVLLLVWANFVPILSLLQLKQIPSKHPTLDWLNSLFSSSAENCSPMVAHYMF